MAYETEYTDFDPQEDSSACLTLGLATDIVESRYLRDFSTAEPEEKQQILKDLTTFLEQLLRQPQISGSADAWHNLCVDLARIDAYDLACLVLQRGLDFYPKNVDLLADYLQYGMECGQGERCKAVCKTLNKVSKALWTWRGYRFLISYYKEQLLLSGTEKELEKYKAEIDQLLKLYRQQFPDDEGSYDCEADVCRELNDRRREEAVLREALEKLKVAPKCAMQLAVMLFERGEYQEALRHAQRALRDSIQTQMGVNEAHLSYLSGLAKFAILLLNEETDGYPENAVMDIYTDFETALRQGLNSTYRSTLKQRAIRLVVKSKINVPSDCEELNYLLN